MKTIKNKFENRNLRALGLLLILSLISYLLSFSSCDNPSGSQTDLILPAPSPGPSLTSGDGELYVQFTYIPTATGYNIYYSDTETPPAKPGIYVPQPTGTKLVDTYITGLTNRVTYWVWAQALYVDGHSELSDPGSMATRPVPEGPPQNIAPYPDYSSIGISWDRVPDRDYYPGAYADSYMVYYDTDAKSAPDDKTSKASFTWVKGCDVMGLLQKLDNTKSYYIWMSSVNTSGETKKSDRIGPITPLSSAQEPQAVTVMPDLRTGDASLSVQWNAVKYAQSYRVYYKEKADPTTSDNYITVEQDAGTISASITGLTNSVNYHVGIAAVSGAIEKAISPINNETPHEKDPLNMSNANQLIGKAAARFPNEEAGKGDRLARKKETAFSDLVGDAMVHWAEKHKSDYGVTDHIDFAIYNGGVIEDGIPQGDIRNGTISHILYADNMSILKMTGEDILTLFNDRVAKVPHTGGGGTGTGAFGQVSKEVRYTLDYAGTKSDGTIYNLTINGEPFNPAQTYCFVTSTYLVDGGDGYGTFFAVNTLNKKTNKLIAESVCDYIYDQNMADLVPSIDGRITLVGELWK